MITVFVFLRKSINTFFSKILIILQMLEGVFEIAFKLFHLLANLFFQVFSIQFVIYICICVCPYRNEIKWAHLSKCSHLQCNCELVYRECTKLVSHYCDPVPGFSNKVSSLKCKISSLSYTPTKQDQIHKAFFLIH